MWADFGNFEEIPNENNLQLSYVSELYQMFCIVCALIIVIKVPFHSTAAHDVKKNTDCIKEQRLGINFLFLPTEQKSYIKRIILLEKNTRWKGEMLFCIPLLELLYSTTFLYILPAPPQISGPSHL